MATYITTHVATVVITFCNLSESKIFRIKMLSISTIIPSDARPKAERSLGNCVEKEENGWKKKVRRRQTTMFFVPPPPYIFCKFEEKFHILKKILSFWNATKISGRLNYAKKNSIRGFSIIVNSSKIFSIDLLRIFYSKFTIEILNQFTLQNHYL